MLRFAHLVVKAANDSVQPLNIIKSDELLAFVFNTGRGGGKISPGSAGQRPVLCAIPQNLL